VTFKKKITYFNIFNYTIFKTVSEVQRSGKIETKENL